MTVIRNLLLLIILFVWSAVFGQTGRAITDLERAQEAMQTNDFTTAIENYEAVLASGYTAANLHYNLGTAYYQAGKVGRAILHYERGLKLAPHHRDLRFNLGFVRRQQEGLPAPYPGFFLSRWWTGLAGWLSPSAWAVLLLSLLWLALLAYLAWANSRRSFWWGKPLSLLLLAIALLSCGFAFERRAALQRTDRAIVIDAAQQLRVAPGLDAPEAGTEVPEGLRLRLIDEYEDWRKVELENGRQGWLPTTGLGVI